MDPRKWLKYNHWNSSKSNSWNNQKSRVSWTAQSKMQANTIRKKYRKTKKKQIPKRFYWRSKENSNKSIQSLKSKLRRGLRTERKKMKRLRKSRKNHQPWNQQDRMWIGKLPKKTIFIYPTIMDTFQVQKVNFQPMTPKFKRIKMKIQYKYFRIGRESNRQC